MGFENLSLTGTAAVGGTGNASANTLIGNSGANILSGVDGNDTLDGGVGTDTLTGGVGNDLLVVDATTDVVVETAAGGTDTVQSAVTYTLAADLENLTLTGSAVINGTGNTLANTITGNTGNNLLSGLGGDDQLYGGVGNDALDGSIGNDTLDGGTGNDTLTGGTGNDTYLVDSTSDIVTEAVSAGIDLVQSSATFTLAADVENLMLIGATAINGTGNAFLNTITGTTGANLLFGLDRNDSLSGSDGNDSLDGGIGNDILNGGAGNDTFVVDAAGDIIEEIVGGGTADRVNASVTFVLAADDSIEILATTSAAGTTAINLTGNALAQSITGNAGVNRLEDGLGAADTLTGGVGNDTYVARNAGTLIAEGVGAGTSDRVSVSMSFVLVADDGIEVLSTTSSAGTTALNLTGNAIAQAIVGNAGINRLNGGAGSDTVTGGLGADVFVFTSTLGATNVDTIADYSVTDDRIEIDDAVFGSVLAGALAATAFSSNLTGLAATAAQRVIYETDTGFLWFDADGTGAGAGVRFANLTVGVVMAASEFTVI